MTIPEAGSQARRNRAAAFLDRHSGVLLGSCIAIAGVFAGLVVQITNSNRQLAQSRAERQQHEALQVFDELSRALNALDYREEQAWLAVEQHRRPGLTDSAVTAYRLVAESWVIEEPRYRALALSYFGPYADSSVRARGLSIETERQLLDTAVRAVQDTSIKSAPCDRNKPRACARPTHADFVSAFGTHFGATGRQLAAVARANDSDIERMMALAILKGRVGDHAVGDATLGDLSEADSLLRHIPPRVRFETLPAAPRVQPRRR